MTFTQNWQTQSIYFSCFFMSCIVFYQTTHIWFCSCQENSMRRSLIYVTNIILLQILWNTCFQIFNTINENPTAYDTCVFSKVVTPFSKDFYQNKYHTINYSWVKFNYLSHVDWTHTHFTIFSRFKSTEFHLFLLPTISVQLTQANNINGLTTNYMVPSCHFQTLLLISQRRIHYSCGIV